MVIDTPVSRVFPSDQRLEKLRVVVHDFLSQPHQLAHQWRVLLGILSSLEKLVPHGRLHKGSSVSGDERRSSLVVEQLESLEGCSSAFSSPDFFLVSDTSLESEAVVPRKGKAPGMKIFHRFHFSSQLKRMSVITGYTQSGSADVLYLATVKGAPETLRPMFSTLPPNYDSIYLELSRRGARVLALGRKELGKLSHAEVRETSREKLECDLTFAGFIIISCPLKRDSKEVIKEILQSSHAAVMITGDNSLTACHVAKELRFTQKKATLILQHPGYFTHYILNNT
ncbi:endoplasmic reticulum transmembrane helix translocase-like [Macrobrachium nipponense]|uniref:endoplasmic reticulum transmembrane helix translocase-like n=1 Tax=Macrobrachium nipponense TaxID=159736 RepID=UPI0030C7AE08